LSGLILPIAPSAADATIVLDPQTTYQTITGWEATAQSGQIACSPAGFVHSPGNPVVCPDYLKYRGALMNLAAGDLGITRLRVEINPAVENPTDYFQRYMDGQLSEDDWVHTYAIQAVNDNNDPNSINSAGFKWSMLDNTIENVVLPLRESLATLGVKLFVNICYVSFRTSPSGYYHWDHPAEYGEFVLASYKHMQEKYGFAPDGWEVVLEPDNTAFNGAKMGQAIAAAGPLLEANGFAPYFIAPSTTNATNAQTYFNEIAAVIGAEGVRKYIGELSYHRYAGVSDAVLQWIGSTSLSYGIGAGMLEHIGSGYEALHQDLKVANNSSWQQFTLAYPTDDNGAQYYTIDTSDPQNPKPQLGSGTKFLRQYFKFIRPGAVRINAKGNATFDPVAFINPGHKYVVVVKAASGGTFSVHDLPAGAYGLTYTTAADYDIDLPNVTLSAGEDLTASIPAAGVISIYSTVPSGSRWMPLMLKRAAFAN